MIRWGPKGEPASGLYRPHQLVRQPDGAHRAGWQQGFEEVSTFDQFGLGEIVAVERKKIERHEDGMRDVSLPPH